LKKFPADIAFIHPWRKYQKRVLNELQDHLEDDHLHLIAPPGAGKTVLGLEVMLRLDQPTLILAPTLTIRNQWVERFHELFIKSSQVPDWISLDINNPGFLTVSTYQSLHATFKREYTEPSYYEIEKQPDAGSMPKFLKRFRSQELGTLMVDEAHHLKNEWWKALNLLKVYLKPTVVGLTATPPYDVTGAEWLRYLELNGPVDTEISVPELVKEGDLCPHQDYIVFSTPTASEQSKIIKASNRVSDLFENLKKDPVLIKAMLGHSFYHDPLNQLERIYSEMEYFSALLIFLSNLGYAPSSDHLLVLGHKKLKLPPLNYYWMEVLLTFYYKSKGLDFESYKDHQLELLAKLKRNGVVERGTIRFGHNASTNRLLTSSISKLQSITSIVRLEKENLSTQLRMVILSDYVRQEYISAQSSEMVLNKIGVVPIFEKLRRSFSELKIGVLTGSLIILPKYAFETFSKTIQSNPATSFYSERLPNDSNFVLIKIGDSIRSRAVEVVTSIFQNGMVEVLVGTKSLLGEGWDAPKINSLILASFVGSFVLSNQMRGRAIRIDPHDALKTSNIWHLVCYDHLDAEGGEDMELLKRRFKAFVGVSYDEPFNLTNGINRLGIPQHINQEESLDSMNQDTWNLAADRAHLRNSWELALTSGDRLIEEMKFPFDEPKPYREVKGFYLRKTIGYLMAVIGSWFLFYSEIALDWLASLISRNSGNPKFIFFILIIIFATGILWISKELILAAKLYWNYRDISKDIHNIGLALLESLIEIDLIKPNQGNVYIKTRADAEGVVYCHLEGGSTYDRSVFIKCLQEVTGLVESPRYIIIRKSALFGLLKQQDYHSVPEALGRNKKLAQIFVKNWRRYVGNCRLIFTRSLEGRKLVLKARFNSLAAQLTEKSEIINKWQ